MALRSVPLTGLVSSIMPISLPVCKMQTTQLQFPLLQIFRLQVVTVRIFDNFLPFRSLILVIGAGTATDRGYPADCVPGYTCSGPGVYGYYVCLLS